MDILYLVLVSVVLTGAITYTIYYVTKDKKSAKKTGLTEIETYIDENFMEDIEGEFEGRIYKKAESAEIQERYTGRYPSCFGSVDIYKVCKRECGVFKECDSTVKVLERL